MDCNNNTTTTQQQNTTNTQHNTTNTTRQPTTTTTTTTTITTTATQQNNSAILSKFACFFSQRKEFSTLIMAQSLCGAHEKPFVGRSRRPNRNATQRREQANRATARFVSRVLCMASMTHRSFAVGGELAELAARLRRAPGDAASIEAERSVEFQREHLRQERLEAEQAADLGRQRANQKRQRMEQERIEAERLVLERKCEEQKRQRMDQERIEAELRRSAELERQRMEREWLGRPASSNGVRCWTPMRQ